jgi:UDP-2-acetamido-2,6-beta-L-arabino-hexul-4-ose reductase
MKVGITGWRGFIGSYLKEAIKDPILFQGDLRKIADVKEFVRSCDVIYHIAGKNRDDEGNILANNLVATGNLVMATRLLSVSPEIIFASSKQTQTNPNSEYGTTKLIEEKIVKTANKWCIFRIPNVYGERCKPFYNSVISTFAYQLAHNKQPEIKDPTVTRDFIYVQDLIELLLKYKLNEIIGIKGEKMCIGEIYQYMTSKLGQHKKLAQVLEYYRGIK